MSKTFRNDYNLDMITAHVERVETCMDCGVELYREEEQFGICGDCMNAQFDTEFDEFNEYADADGSIDENDAEALAWLAGTV